MTDASALVDFAFDDVPKVVRVFVESFRDYPVMRYVLGDSPDYEARLGRLITLFVMARALREEPMIGVFHDSELCGALTASNPDNPASPPAFTELREKTWRTLGAQSLQRYDRCVAAWQPLAVRVPQLHVNMIGVRPAFQGMGLARRLLEHAHELSAQSPSVTGVTLTTEVLANVRFYEHLGYQISGHTSITSELETWALFRPNDPSNAAPFASIPVA